MCTCSSAMKAHLREEMRNPMSIKKQNAYIFPQLIGKVLLVLLSLLMVACTSTSMPARHTTSTPPQITPPAEPTAAPGSVAVYVSLVEFRISSSRTVFHAGTPYHFVITNRG